MNNKTIEWAGLAIVVVLAWCIYHGVQINNARRDCKSVYSQQYLVDSNKYPFDKDYQSSLLAILNNNTKLCDAKYNLWDITHWWNGY